MDNKNKNKAKLNLPLSFFARDGKLVGLLNKCDKKGAPYNMQCKKKRDSVGAGREREDPPRQRGGEPAGQSDKDGGACAMSETETVVIELPDGGQEKVIFNTMEKKI